MANPSRFWDKVADRYSRKPVSDEDAYQKKLQITREYFEPDMEVLEFGCGTGSTAINHAPYVRHIHAIDISPRMIEIAQGKADAGGIQNVTFERASIDEFKATAESFDVVLGLSILHLLENKDVVVSKIFAMLKPGGIFVSNTACIGDTMKVFKLVAPIGRFFKILPIVKIFTSEELHNCLTVAGFEVELQWQPRKGRAEFVVARKPA